MKSPNQAGEKKRKNRNPAKEGAVAGGIAGAVTGALSAIFVNFGRALASGFVIDLVIVLAFTGTAFVWFMQVGEYLLAFSSLALLVLWYLAREQIRRGRQ